MVQTTIKPSDIKVTREGRMFKFYTPEQISQEQAIDLQGDLCYPAAGYGFYRFESTPTGTTWYCGDSSD